jgi:HD superfamily phosphohydrolase
MKGNIKEIRDPIHNFIHVDRDEMQLIDTQPFQRLRHIHQLALTYLVYPGASHKRFEHSLGVMELAGRAYDSMTNQEHIDDRIRRQFPEITKEDFVRYWRKVLRLAALCHDIGHLPFSHAAEKELFPPGFTHETMTQKLIESEEMQKVFTRMIPPITPAHVVKLALGPKEASDLEYSDWETLLAEIITGNTLGVDRMDYLLRDAYHAGVGYGKFDHFRLLETLRIVPPPPEPARIESLQQELPLPQPPPSDEVSAEPMLGVLMGGVHSAEALLLARYFMYAQVYFHHVRIAYDKHLKDFLVDWLPGNKASTECKGHLALTDNEVNAAMRAAALDSGKPGHKAAKRVICREHFKLLRQFTVEELRNHPNLPDEVLQQLGNEFGAGNFIRFVYDEKRSPKKFTVRLKDGNPASSLAVSELLMSMPVLSLGFILVEPTLRNRAAAWLKEHSTTH